MATCPQNIRCARPRRCSSTLRSPFLDHMVRSGGAGYSPASRKLVLVSFCNRLRARQGPLSELLALAFDRVAMSGPLTRWNPSAEKMQHTSGRRALPFVRSFAEVAPLTDSPGDWASGYELIADVIGAIPESLKTGVARLADARHLPLADEDADLWFTDPPYYDEIPYADLSDFFFVWLKRLLLGNRLLRDRLDPINPLTPKKQEAAQDETKSVDGHPKEPCLLRKHNG